jgi:hypothetical protein
LAKPQRTAPFDAICSIKEMVEAVDSRGIGPSTSRRSFARLLKPGSYATIQSIVIADDLF